MCNGSIVTAANQAVFRDDLQEAYGFGQCGFSITIPPTTTPEDFATLTVVEEASGNIIDASCAKVMMLYGGGIEHHSRSLITGYVFDSRPRLTLPCVTLVYENNVVASCLPLFRRRDMRNVFETDDVWQFMLQVPAMLQDGDSELAVEIDGEPGLFRQVMQNALSEKVAQLSAEYFDAAWYQTYPECAGCDFSSMTPLEHFLAVGYYQGLSPTPLFDAEWYVGTVPGLPEALAAGQIVSAFQHYIDYGLLSGLDPHPLISREYIERTLAGFTCGADGGIIAGIMDGRLPIAAINPLVNDSAQSWEHELLRWRDRLAEASLNFRLQAVGYLYFARVRDRTPPNPRYFDVAWYVARNAIRGLGGGDTLGAMSHYFRIGRQLGADPHPLVSTAFFARQQRSTTPELAAQGGLLSILLSHDPEMIGLNPFIPSWSRSANCAMFESGRGRAFPASPYIDDEWHFSNNPQAREARELGFIGSATEHLTRALDREIDAPHPFFAREWYLATYPDAVSAISMGRSPNSFAYFVEFGQHLGHDPHPAFDSAWYRDRWTISPWLETPDGTPHQTAFEYFYSTGIRLNRFPSPYFWNETSISLYGEVSTAPESGERDGSTEIRFLKFMRHWGLANFQPNIAFDPEYYLERARTLGIDVRNVGNTFTHYLMVGVESGIEPNAFFNSTWYKHRYVSGGDAANAFEHYCGIGCRKGYSPNPFFDEDYYLAIYPDVRQEVERKTIASGFAHYCHLGWRENRATHPYLHLHDVSDSGAEARIGARGSLDRYVTRSRTGARPVPDLGQLFHEDWYTIVYPEVKSEMELFNLPTGFAHYIHIGIHRLRSPGPLFDEVFYRRANADLESALSKGDVSSGYYHFCNTRAEDRAWHPLISFKELLSPVVGSKGFGPGPSAIRHELIGTASTIATSTFDTLATELRYWTSVCTSDSENYWAAMQLVCTAAQLNDRPAIERWLPLARTGKLEPWRALSLALIERCFSTGDLGASQARSAFSSLFRNAAPTFVVETPLPHQIICGKPTVISINCVCYHRLYESVELEICIGGRSIPLSPQRAIRYDVYEACRDSDLLGHSLYSGLNDYITVDDFEPGTTAAVVFRMRVQDASGIYHVFSVPAGDIRFLPCPVTAPPLLSNASGPRRIAICMATFQPDLELFARQVRSIMLQHHSAWTLFISDDASPPEHVRGMMRETANDPRIVFQANRERVGFCKNFERAISLAGPDYDAFALCDQDDEWFPDKLSVLDTALQGENVLVYSDMEICTRDRTALSKSFWTTRTNYCEDINDVLVANSVTGAASLVHRRVLELALPFPDISGLYHDHWLALCALAVGRIEFVPTALHRYVQHGQNVLGFANSVKPSLAFEHFRRRYLEIRQLSRKPITELTRTELNALINASLVYGEITRLEAIVATILRRVANMENQDLNTASLAALWMQDRQFPTAAALAHVHRQRDAGVRKTLGAEFRLATSVIATKALQREKAQVVSRVLRFDATGLRSKVICKDSSLQTLPSTNVATWRDHLRTKIRPLVLSADETAQPSLRVNFLIPELTLSVFFGGYLGKFHLIKKLLDRGLAVRVITLDHYVQNVGTIASIEEKYPEFVGLFSRIEIIDRYDRAESVPLHNRDVFLATTWWSAHVAEDARRRTNKAAFFYLIQEFEPFTFAMGSWYATAMESYSFPHHALFSTDLLQEYFRAEQMGVFSAGTAGQTSSRAFSNAIVDGAKHSAPPAIHGEGGKNIRRLLFYARPEPHASRNMFEMGIASLIVAIQQGVFPAGEWEFIGIGSASADFELHGGATLRMIGKMGLNDYYSFLQTVDVGLALMFTPHPSLVPLDMASFGVATVTNTCLNKDAAALRAISPNLIPAPPTIAGIVDGLREAGKLVQEQPKLERVGQVKWAMTWDEALNGDVMDFVVRSLQELGRGDLAEPATAAAPARKGGRPRLGARGRSG